jgi:2-polyprenyl-6-methoxyphenol hydroxylase-like FAD-dependent oxidoreductase
MVPPHKPEHPTLGQTAIVVGASIAGLSAAAALAKHFEQVLVLERDTLPLRAAQRPSVPQGWHVHSLVAGGLQALERLFPGLSGELNAAGAVQVHWDLDVLVERVPFDHVPRRDCGFFSFALSRPLLEASLRARVRALPNVELVDGVNVQRLVPDADTRCVRAVEWKDERAKREERSADLVVDCSGRSDLTLQLFRELGVPVPPESVVGVGVTYSSALFEQTPGERDWKAAMTLANAPLASACGLLAPIEALGS